MRTSKCRTELASGSYRKAVFVSEDGRGAYLSNCGHQDASKTFSYDNVVDEETSQEKVFDLVGKPLADAFLNGYHCNLLAYGQTGAGKTYTMQGKDETETRSWMADIQAFTDPQPVPDAELGSGPSVRE